MNIGLIILTGIGIGIGYILVGLFHLYLDRRERRAYERWKEQNNKLLGR